MAKLANFKSQPVFEGDYFIGGGARGGTKKIEMNSVIETVKNALYTLENFSVKNNDNAYSLHWNNNTLSITGPDTYADINSISTLGPLSNVHSGKSLELFLNYEGNANIIAVASNHKGNTEHLNLLVENNLTNEVTKLALDKLPFTNSAGTVTEVNIADGNGTAATITEKGTINIKGGNGITTSMVGADLTIEYLGKVGGTVNNVISLDETVLLTNVSQDGSEVSIRPARVPVRIGKYDFASVTVDQYGRVTQIEDQKNKIDALIARINTLEEQLIALQNESSTDTSN
jgi:hypothetical protein